MWGQKRLVSNAKPKTGMPGFSGIEPGPPASSDREWQGLPRVQTKHRRWPIHRPPLYLNLILDGEGKSQYLHPSGSPRKPAKVIMRLKVATQASTERVAKCDGSKAASTRPGAKRQFVRSSDAWRADAAKPAREWQICATFLLRRGPPSDDSPELTGDKDTKTAFASP